ncbi:MAG: hypothetical protein IPN86_01590 [Saprospiraceae bacterium]|nr:hypothetical protein [Saprospiraceae bacterium]
MGLSFHYRGRLKSATTLPSLVDEVEDICKVLNWKCSVFETEYPDNKFVTPINDSDYGILFSPPSCEPVSLVFDSEGKIYTPWLKEILNKHKSGEVKVITVKLNLDDDNPVPEISEESEDFDPLDMVYSISVKTQFAGAESHVQLMELLRYLSEKYLTEFHIQDESDYWNTRNAEKLHEKMNKINQFMDTFHDMMDNQNIKDPKDFIAFLKQLSMQIKKKGDE